MPSAKSKIVLHTFRNAEKNNQLCGVVKISPKAEQKLFRACKRNRIINPHYSKRAYFTGGRDC